MMEYSEAIVMKSAFATINRILRYIEEQLDNDCFDFKGFTAKNFGITENRFARYLNMLLKGGYISGIKVIDQGEADAFSDTESRYAIRFDDSVEITVKGLQFLAENTAWAKMYKTVKNIRDLIP
ncbi:MAG: hypothetical protein IJM03_02960 [Treponema sp.]|nr:hypothetical protein [Treponema sp.]MBR0124283.1 hypothetical protein [Treponema sp.]